MSRSNTFNLRKRPRISYYEPQEPDLDEYVFCTDCADFVYEYCSIHGPLLVIPDDKVPLKHSVPAIVPRAALTIPHVFLHLARSIIPGAGIGVFTTLTLPRGVRFGPYRGQRTDEIKSNYCWQIHGNDNRAAHVIDAADPGRSNWMRYVNCSRHWCEQNLIAFQYQGQIYYRTTRIIPRFTELMVFYGSEFANRLGVDLKRYNAPASFAERLGTITSQKFAPAQDKIIAAPSVKERDNQKALERKFQETTKKPKTLVKKRHKKNIIDQQANYDKPDMKMNNDLKLGAYNNNTDQIHLCNSIKDISKPEKIRQKIHSNNNNKLSIDEVFEKISTADEVTLINSEATPDADLTLGKAFDSTGSADGVNRNNNNNEATIINSVIDNASETIAIVDKTKIYNDNMVLNNILYCEICPFKTNTQKYLNSHLRAHAAKKSFNCDKCHYKTVKMKSLEIHIRIHSGVKPYICTVCNKAFKHQNDLQRHLRIHSGVKLYICTVCNKAFNRQNSLQIHLRIHSGVKPYICTVCNKAFNQQNSLQIHLRIHSGVKPYVCTVCNKAFNQQNSLQIHLRIHSGVKPYICTVCNKAFNQQNSLQIHLRIHSGVKPYICTVCNKAFNRQNSLQIHLRIHSGVKPYICTVCNKAFNQQSNFQTHLKIHSGVKPYICTVCNKGFSAKTYLKRHLLIHS